MLTTNYDAMTLTPIGLVGVRLCKEKLAGIDFLPANSPEQAPTSAAATEAIRQICAYFADPCFSPDLPLLDQGTDFQRRVWQALRTIPPSTVLTYGALAQRLGSAPRAVGGACRANPWPILVPCHRVVAAHSLGGYTGATAGYWLEIKAWLLRHEGAIIGELTLLGY
jgi:methylated-DNA-[protein]-cysteine S-methyltransferase